MGYGIPRRAPLGESRRLSLGSSRFPAHGMIGNFLMHEIEAFGKDFDKY